MLQTRNAHLQKADDLVDEELPILQELPWAGVLSGQLKPARYHDKRRRKPVNSLLNNLINISSLKHILWYNLGFFCFLIFL